MLTILLLWQQNAYHFASGEMYQIVTEADLTVLKRARCLNLEKLSKTKKTDP
ncbi:MAG: hypothetical protein HC929_00715 [Leptolyngbyaceae cyanobacterium SM2_5_2]|nr:hypothetical protein [Leptolyngbyaceae cyanobacterium SM2_5_2]